MSSVFSSRLTSLAARASIGILAVAPVIALLPSASASAATAGLVSTASHATPHGSTTTVAVTAHASLFGGTGADMQLWVKGSRVAETTVSNTADKTFTYAVPGKLSATDQIDVAFTNDAYTATGGDRNLYVTSVKVGTTLLNPAKAIYDLGTDRASMTDGVSTLPGTTAMNCNGALRWNVPAKTAVAPTTAPTTTTPAPVSTPTATPATSSRPSRMPWDSGTFSEEKASVATTFAAQRGADLDVWTTFADSTSKAAESSTWWLDDVPAGYHGTLSIGVPLWSRDTTVGDAVSGGMDATWRSIAEGLVKGGYSNSYVRLGWEMNLPGTNGREATPANASQWVAAFQRATTVFRTVSPSLRIVFNPNLGSTQTGVQADAVYPGDKYVDVVGVDVYDWWPAFTSDANMAVHQTGSYGLDYWLAFAKSHAKPFALPEWAVSDADSHAGGDNPLFVDYMYGWMQKNSSAMAYEAWYDESDSSCGCSMVSNPKTAAEYTKWIAKLRG